MPLHTILEGQRDVLFTIGEGSFGQGLPQENAHRKDVGPSVDFGGPRLLWRDVGHLALEGTCLGHGLSALRLGNTEVEHFDLAIVGHEEVAGTDISVHDVEGLIVFVGLIVGAEAVKNQSGHQTLLALLLIAVACIGYLISRQVPVTEAVDP